MKQIESIEQLHRRVRVKRIRTSILTHLLMMVLATIFLVPIIWMFSTALKSRWEIFAWPPNWFPSTPQWKNFKEAFTRVPMLRFMGNTL